MLFGYNYSVDDSKDMLYKSSGVEGDEYKLHLGIDDL